MVFRKSIICITLVGLLFSAGCSKKAETTSTTEEKLIPVQVQVPVRKEISTNFTYGGKIEPIKQVSIVSKSPGKVKAVYFDIGDRVKKGDILFRLDEKDIQNNIEVLESQLKVSDVGINNAQTGVSTAKGGQYESQINQLQTGLKTAELRLNDAEKNYNDTKKLYDINAIPKQQYDQVKNSYDQAKIAYDSAKNAYELLVNKTSVESVQLAENQLKQAVVSKGTLQVQLKNARESLADTAVRSTINGIISSRNIQEGEYTSAAIAPFSIIQMDKVTVNVNVTEKIINKIEIGQKVKVTVNSLNGNAFEGIITAISPAADEKSFTYPIKVEISNKQGILKPGMFAEVVFDTEVKENSIVIPREAVITENNLDYVYVVENNLSKKIQVKLGIDSGKEAEILNGITDNQQIIIKGQNYVTDGKKVQVVK